MPVHDWRRVEAGIFHDFHMAWAAELRRSLNEGLLPQGYYVLVEQHAGRSIADVLTRHANPEPLEPDWLPPDTGGIALANAPPRVQRRQTVEQTLLARRRSLAIRHVSGHRLIALIEIIEHLAVGSPLPEMPLFLRPDCYVRRPAGQPIPVGQASACRAGRARYR